jgi:curved DNA-binding protein CbpA
VAEAYGILIDESSRAIYDKSLKENKKAKTRATEEPQQKYVNPKSQAEVLFMTAQAMMKLHEKGNSWSEIIKLLQEDGLSKDGIFAVLALCFQVLKTSIPYKEMVDIASQLHQEGADWLDIVDLIQKSRYSEKMAYKVIRDIAAKEQKRDRIRSKGSTWISLLDALIKGLSNIETRKAFSTKPNYSRSDGDYVRRSRSRYY